MTRRIILDLALDTGAAECGACPHRVLMSCHIFGSLVQPRSKRIERHDGCIEAERAAARMVAKDERTKLVRALADAGDRRDADECDRIEAMISELDEHAKKAGER